MNTELLERLREERQELATKLEAAKKDRGPIAADLDFLDMRIEDIENGKPLCRNCGSDEIKAHWRDWTSAPLEGIEVSSKGQVLYDYLAVAGGHTDAGDDEEYECMSCGLTSPNLEYLLGVTEHEYTPAEYMERYAGLLHQVGLIIQDRRDRSYEGLDTQDDPVWVYLNEHLGELYDRFGAIIDSVEAEIFDTEEEQ